MITTCTKCGDLYEAGSEEQAYEPVRFCSICREEEKMGKTIKGFYVLAGETSDDIPDAATMKSVGGRVVFGQFYVEHRMNAAEERFPWVVKERTLVGVARPAEDYIEVETYPQYREALRAARRLAVLRHIMPYQPVA